MGLGPAELVFLAFILFNLIFPIWGIIDAAIRPDTVWAATGQNKIVWVLVQVFRRSANLSRTAWRNG